MTRKGPKSDIFFLSSILYQKSCAPNFGPNCKKKLRPLDFHTLRLARSNSKYHYTVATSSYQYTTVATPHGDCIPEIIEYMNCRN